MNISDSLEKSLSKNKIEKKILDCLNLLEVLLRSRIPADALEHQKYINNIKETRLHIEMTMNNWLSQSINDYWNQAPSGVEGHLKNVMNLINDYEKNKKLKDEYKEYYDKYLSIKPLSADLRQKKHIDAIYNMISVMSKITMQYTL